MKSSALDLLKEMLESDPDRVLRAFFNKFCPCDLNLRKNCFLDIIYPEDCRDCWNEVIKNG